MNNAITTIFEEIEKNRKVAYQKGFPLPKFEIKFDLKGAVGGQAQWRRHGNFETYTLRVNLPIAEENLEHYLKTTIPHELAHLLQFKYHAGSKPHGKEWKGWCKFLTGRELPRCHDYEVSHLKRKKIVKRHLYQCACQQHKISTIAHNRISKKGYEYSCVKCGEPIKSLNSFTFKN